MWFPQRRKGRVSQTITEQNWTFLQHATHNLPGNFQFSPAEFRFEFVRSRIWNTISSATARSADLGNKVIGIGIIGAGFARTTQIPAFKDCIGARVVAIASAHRENAESVAEEFKIRQVY